MPGKKPGKSSGATRKELDAFKGKLESIFKSPVFSFRELPDGRMKPLDEKSRKAQKRDPAIGRQRRGSKR